MRKTNYLVGGLAFLALAGCEPEKNAQPNSKPVPVQTTQKVHETPVYKSEDLVTYESLSTKLNEYKKIGYLSDSDYSDFSRSLNAIKTFDDPETKKVLKSLDGALETLKISDETQRKISGKSREEWNTYKIQEEKEFENFMKKN